MPNPCTTSRRRYHDWRIWNSTTDQPPCQKASVAVGRDLDNDCLRFAQACYCHTPMPCFTLHHSHFEMP